MNFPDGSPVATAFLTSFKECSSRMAYTDKHGMDSSKAGSMVIVGLVTALIIYLLVAVNYDRIKKTAEELKVIDIEEPPPPPEKLPPPPPKTALPPPPVVAPPPIVVTNTAPQVITTVATPPPVFIPTPEPPRPAPPPPPPPAAVKLTPRGNFQSLMSTDDYPPSALREGAEGTTGYRLEIGPDGKVTSCSVTQSSGSSQLDDTTCRLLTRRARFNPGKDSAGNPTGGVYPGRFKWVIPK
ncbi:MAG: energy transducer TonB [Sphingomonadales bacterium]|nr:energy transducer TonB [Sphingomonadales bacterium]